MTDFARAPFPWFGGKRRVADVVWRAFGPDVNNYVEPFAGSLAVLLARPGGAGKIETVNDRDRMVCVAPETRVLMGDLSWRAAGELQAGDDILAFDEENPGAARDGLRAPTRYRRWRHSKVVAAPRVKLPCYRLTFDDGTTVIASEDHCWLAGSHKTGAGGRGWRWVKTKSLVCNRKTQRSWVLKLAAVASRRDDWETGWIAGLFDGEGSVVRNASTPRICVSQNPGAVLERAEAWLTANGFDYERSDAKKCVRLTLRGGLREQMRFLMLARPVRLLRRFLELVPECSLYARSHSAVGLVSKEYLGEREVVALATSTKTFVAEGLASHNCNFWRAVTADPRAVAEHCDWPVNEADLHARHKWLVSQLPMMREQMHIDPDFFDVKIAGWWVWGICQWIGGGWCAEPQNHKHPKLDGIGKGVHSERGHRRSRHTENPSRQGVHSETHRKMIAGDTRRGVHSQQLPVYEGCDAMGGVHAPTLGGARRPQMTSAGQGVHLPSLGNDRGILGVAAPPCEEWFRQLQARLRRVRVACGDWKRVLGPSVLGKGKNVGGRRPCAVFLDPPYSHEFRDPGLYNEDDGKVAELAREWALEHGDDPDLRIALCGYAGEHEMPASWREVEWKAARGYAAEDNENRERERIWFSPHCLQTGRQAELFAGNLKGNKT